MKIKNHYLPSFIAFLFLLIGLQALNGCGSDCESKENPVTSGEFPDFPAKFSPEIPHDVNPEVYYSLDPATSLDPANAANLAKLKRLFNIYSWQAFIAINWPIAVDGKPKGSFTDSGERRWMHWMEYFKVFNDSGAPPPPWTAGRGPYSGPPHTHQSALPGSPDHNTRLLYLVDKHKAIPRNKVDEFNQAFTGPLVDQNGNVVRYEILLNKDEYDYIVANQLYNLNGQIEFSKNNDTTVNMPRGVYGNPDSMGAIEIKLAWKILEKDKDDFNRYYHIKSLVHDDGGKGTGWVEKEVGLVGMHISQKTATAKQWVWSTFEQVDNIEVNDFATGTINAQKKNIQPSFRNNYCPTCKVNTLNYQPNGADSTLQPAQMQRVIPIPKAVAELNRQVQALIKATDPNSPWQYYELIDTQWPTDQTVEPTPPGTISTPNNIYTESFMAVENKAGGNMTPAFLTNMTMETYFQTGNEAANNLEEQNPYDGKSFCIDNNIVFGTESCVGCHSSAGVASGNAWLTYKNQDSLLFGKQISGDFSWLLSQKAHWDASIPHPRTDTFSSPPPVPAQNCN